MALSLKQLVRTNTLGKEVWVTDKTGAYAASINTGGWGAPNLLLNQTALIAYLSHITPDSVFSCIPLSSAISYSNLDTNDVSRSIGFTYDGDGHYSSYLFAIPVSSNGTTTLAGDSIAAGDYFVMGGILYIKLISGGNTVITDYSVLVAVSAVPKVQCDKMFYNQLAIKKNDQYYREYRDARDANDPETASDLLKKIEDLEVDIAGADYRFRVGLFTIAENIVEELLEKHAIV